MEFSRKSDFSTIDKTLETERDSISGLELEEGNWFWRVSREKVSTVTRSFSVLSSLSEPTVESPRDGQDIVVSGENGVPLSWKDVSGATRYTVSVLSSDGNEVWQGNAKTSSANVPLKTGNYLARVQAFADGSELAAARTSAVSSVRFSVRTPDSVELLYPDDGSSISGLDALRRATVFSWRFGRDKANDVSFVLSKVESNGKQKEVENRKNARSPVRLERLTAGRYIWKVIANSADGIPLSSNEQSFTIEDVPPLSKVVISQPANGAVLGANFFRKNRRIVLSWKQVSGATAYSFALYRRASDDSLVPISTEKNLRTTSVTISDLASLDVGDFEWNVTAFAYARDGFEERRSPVATGKFTIDFDSPTQVEGVQPGRMYGE